MTRDDLAGRLVGVAAVNGPRSDAEWAQWKLDVEEVTARFRRKHYSIKESSILVEAMVAVELRHADELQSRFGGSKSDPPHHSSTLVQRARYARSRSSIAPGHIEALEQQWRSFRYNKIVSDGAAIIDGRIIMATGNTEMRFSALQAATTDAMAKADCYHWNAQTTLAVAAAADTIPPDCEINETALGALAPLGTCGWWWFDEPIPVKTTAHSGEDEPVVALLWRRERHETGMTTWIQALVLADLGGDDFSAVAIPTTAWVCPDGLRMDGIKGLYSAAYATIEHGAGRNTAGLDATSEASAWFTRFFVAASTWLRQRVVVETEAPGARQAARRLQREHKLAEPPRVKVIDLRRRTTPTAEPSATPEDGDKRSYSCRFVVHGFMRNQWYPKRSEHAPIWIDSYVKGPSDKPLKADAPRIFAVRR